MMEKKYCIYIHINKINNKRYIGQTCQNPEYRWNHGEGYKGSPRFYSAIQHYGWDNFEHIVLYNDLSLDEANSLEEELIAKFHTTDPNYGYNLENGGKNKSSNEETRKKQSEAALKRPTASEETKKKLSEVGLGLKRSEETKKKMSEAATNREKEKNGKKFIPVMCINTNQIFPSCRAAADWCGLAGTSGICSVCKGGKQKTAGVHPTTGEKLTWRYLTEEEENALCNN